MKRIHILLAAALTLFACSKSEIPVYRLEDSAVCFQSVNNNFSMRSLTEPTRDLTIPVVLIGQVTDYARPISFSRDDGTAVEGQDYSVVSAEVPAGSLTGAVVLRANRLEGVTEKTLTLTLHPNEHFREGYPSRLTARIIWTESYERPALGVWRYTTPPLRRRTNTESTTFTATLLSWARASAWSTVRLLKSGATTVFP